MATMEKTERDECFRTVYNAWMERYPSGKPLTDTQIFNLLNDFANDTEYIQEAINTLPDVNSSGYAVDYRMLSNYCKKGIGSKRKRRNQQPVVIGYEEDKNQHLTAYGQHRKMMDTEWHVPIIEEFDPRNAEHLQIQADYLLRSGQIGEPQYELMMKGIPIVTGNVEPTLDEKLHLVLDVSGAEDNEIPF